MGAPKEKRAERVAGRRKFALPPREGRVVDDNPVRDLLRSLDPGGSQGEATAAPAAGGAVFPPPELPAQAAEQVRPAETKPSREGRRAPRLAAARDAEFEYFKQKYGPLLGEARVAVCAAIYDLSYGVGHEECFYSASKLAEATGFSDRYIFKLVGQLEAFGFIEKVEIFNTATKKGTTFRLHLEPAVKPRRA